MNELEALRQVYRTGQALRSTDPVYDNFPEMMHYFDGVIRRVEPLINTYSQIGINDLAQKQFDWVERVGWHNKTVLESLALIASEVGEAVNECRGEEPTKEFGGELADIILRTLDLTVIYKIDIEKEMLNKMSINEKRGTRGRKK